MSNLGKMRVWGGSSDMRGIRLIVAATSQQKAAELAGVSSYRFKHFWSETANVIEVRTALAKPGVVFKSVDIRRRTLYEEVKA